MKKGTVSSHASQAGDFFGVLLARVYTIFWISWVVCTLQKGISAAILHDLCTMNGNLVHGTNYEFSDSFMVEYDLEIV